ncbi:unnamed protein product [Phaeothamnion confervicola]
MAELGRHDAPPAPKRDDLRPSAVKGPESTTSSSCNGDGGGPSKRERVGHGPPAATQNAVLMRSAPVASGTPICRGYDFNNGVDLNGMMAAALTTGFQATNLALAIDEINRMRTWRLSDRPAMENERDEWHDPAVRNATRATLFLSYTSNLISCGLRETIRFLVEHRMVDVLVTTAGGIEEDFIKCLAPTFMGGFGLSGADLRARGQNRIGNLIVPNENYCLLEDWITPLLHEMTDTQVRDGVIWTPSSIIRRLGLAINNPESVYYWAAKHHIPVFCPALTDGSIGDMIYFHKFRRPEFIIDIAGDIKSINDIAVHAPATGMIILGGGVVKHHTCNANLMRNGADFAVFVNTGQEFDGSDSGARPDEAVSWGKIRADARPVKVHADATLVFPLVVSQTFAKDFVPSPRTSPPPPPAPSQVAPEARSGEAEVARTGHVADTGSCSSLPPLRP